MKPYITSHNNDACYSLDLLRMVLDKYQITFSKAIASKLVGGEYRLERLVMDGKIDMDKPTAKQNGKWHCKASDVLRYIKL